MTREEAIKQLKDASDSEVRYGDIDNRYDEVMKRVEAFEMAIEALKQEPCEDAISRQDALDCLTATSLKKFDFILDARDKIKNLPSVTPQYTDAEIQKMQELEQAEIEKAYELGKTEAGQWIPVSERLPEEEKNVLVCNANGDIEISSGSYSTEMKNEFIWYTSGWRFGKVIAWMPLPEPYRAESEGEE